MTTKTSKAKPEKKPGKTKKQKQALDAPRGPSTFKMNPFEIIVLGVDTSDPPADSDLVMLLHKHRIGMPLEQDMLDSIAQNGVEQAITTAKVWLPTGMKVHGRELKKEEQHTIAIDGRRRTLHTRDLCIKAGDKDGTKGSYVVKSSSKSGMSLRELAGLAEELNGTSRHDDILEKAAQARLMVARTQDEVWVASKFHVDVQTLKGWFKLRSDADPSVLDAVKTKRGGINASGATKLTRLPPSKQVEVMEDAIASGKTSAKQIDGLVRKAIAESKGVKPSERPDVAPTKRQLTAALAVIDDSDISFDEFMPWEKVVSETLKWVIDGRVANSRIKELASKSEERMRAKSDKTDKTDKVAAASEE